MASTFVAEPRLSPIRHILVERTEQMTDALTGLAFQKILSPLHKQVLDSAFRLVGAHEGTLWIVEPKEQVLIPVFNTGPDAAKFVGQFKQPLNAGIVSMVMANELTFCENNVYQNQMQDPRLDLRLAVRTSAMMATPFRLGRRNVGVISCVQLRRDDDAQDPPGFAPQDTTVIRQVAQVLNQLIYLQLINEAIGLEQ